MVQMWKHTHDLRERLELGFFENLSKKGAFKFKFTEGIITPII